MGKNSNNFLQELGKEMSDKGNVIFLCPSEEVATTELTEEEQLRYRNSLNELVRYASELISDNKQWKDS